MKISWSLIAKYNCSAYLQVYVLAKGRCMYQGSNKSLISFLETMKLPCTIYHNPADYGNRKIYFQLNCCRSYMSWKYFVVIELSSGEYGEDKIETLVLGCENGKSLKWFQDTDSFKGIYTQVHGLDTKRCVIYRVFCIGKNRTDRTKGIFLQLCFL